MNTPLPIVNSTPVDNSKLLQYLSNLSIINVTNVPILVQPTIDDLLRIDTGEISDNYLIRRQLTYNIQSIPDVKISAPAAVAIGRMLTNKATLGTVYDSETEAVLKYIIDLLSR